jgi:hypothetical protein
MKRVKGVEDLNICIIGTQGIVGVGASSSTTTDSSFNDSPATQATGEASSAAVSAPCIDSPRPRSHFPDYISEGPL